MKTAIACTALLATLPSAYAWGVLGHDTVAYVASNLVKPATKQFAQRILADNSGDYLANVASWADSFRSTSAGRFSAPFHFIDANDNPPQSCSVDFARDCGAGGCVVSAINNYTSRVQDKTLNAASVTDALKFLVHFIGDIHQPLHDEGLDRGGNQIPVTFDGKATNLHATWDTSIPQKIAGSATLPNAHKFAATLTTRIKTGAYKSMTAAWLKGIDINDPVTTGTGWAAGANAYVCSLVLKDGITVVEGQDLGGAYFTKASPAVEMLLAQAGYRLAAWLDLLATGSVGANKTVRRAHVGIVERSSLLEREPGLFDVDGDTCERALE